MNNNLAKNLEKVEPITLPKRKISLNVLAISFWLIFALSYLYLDRLFIVATNDKFRLGIVVTGLGLLAIVASMKIVKNLFLALGIIALVGIALTSAWKNNISTLQLIAFIRIPLVVYLVYNLVWYFLGSEARVEKVLRYMYIIAALQLPVIIIQRIAYPWLPEWFKLNASLVDFGMGTFSGDTPMAFALITLVILLLFNHQVNKIVRRKWLTAAWLSLTVLFSNSQIQQITIVLVWIIYIISHLRLINIIIGFTLTTFIFGVLIIFSLSDLMTFPYLQNTIVKVTQITQVFDKNIDYEVFLSGGHDRVAAISYYLNQPVKWIGDGPGSVYNTATGQRKVGGWGHIFTFYAEVGLIGLVISYLIFFSIAFPIHFGSHKFQMRASWTRALIFMTIIIVTFIKYPMGDSAIIFTYCIVLISNQKLSTNITSDYLVPSQEIPTLFQI